MASLESLFHDKGEFHLEAGSEKTAGGDLRTIVVEHVIGDVAVIRLRHLGCHLHGAGCQTDLMADDPSAFGDPRFRPITLNGVGVLS